MGYLADKQDKELPIIEMKELEGIPFRFVRVCIRDIPSQWGVQHKAVSDVVSDDGERFTVFLSGTVVVSALEEGLADGHDWTTDDTFYVIEKIPKKDGTGSYWRLREA